MDLWRMFIWGGSPFRTVEKEKESGNLITKRALGMQGKIGKFKGA
jgi:hypothetical protein